jgi:hypothetical protein
MPQLYISNVRKLHFGIGLGPAIGTKSQKEWPPVEVEK